MRMYLIATIVAGLTVLAPQAADAQYRSGMRAGGGVSDSLRGVRSAKLRPWVGPYGSDLSSSRRRIGDRVFDRTRYVPGIGTGYYRGFGGVPLGSTTQINFINEAPDPVPAVLGIRAAPVGEPVVYVLNTRREGRQRSSSAGPRVISMDGSVSETRTGSIEGGARIVHLSPR